MSEPFTTRPSPAEHYGTAVQVCIAASLVIAVWVAYEAGLSGPFIFDDFSNITGNRLIAIDRLSLHELAGAASSGSDGTLNRPLPRMTFALNYFFAGKMFDPFVFKMTNLVLHAANVLLVFLLLRKLFSAGSGTGRRNEIAAVDRRAVIMAALAAALWGLHPINLSSVLYVVQRMTDMSAFFVLVGLVIFIRGRSLFPTKSANGVALMTGAVVGGVSLGFLCKENAILLPLFAVTVELTFFSRRNLTASAKRHLMIFYATMLILPAAVGVVYLVFNPNFILGSYESREFNLVERLLTEPRVMFFYLSLILVPSISRLGLHHDDFQLSTGLLAPPSTLLALLAWGLIIVLIVWGLRKRTIWAFGITWFLAGHALESTIIGLELAYEHRNYLPGIGICAMIIYYLAALIERRRSGVGMLVVSGLCVVLAFGFVTRTRAEIWNTRLSLFESLARHHPSSYRALAGLAITMIDTRRDVREVYRTYARAARANEHAIFPLVWMVRILHGLNASNLPRDTAADATSERYSENLPWDSELILERNRLEAIERAVINEVRSRLSVRKPHIETIESLIAVQRCLLNGRDDCIGLGDELMAWHMLALRHLPASTRERAKLELSLAKLSFARGDFDSARAYVDRAVATSGKEAAYRLEKALFNIRLGNVAVAAEIIDDVERGMGWSRIHADDIEYLRREMRKAPPRDGAAGPESN